LYGAYVTTSDVELGLRERKNRRTQRAIVRAAAELILEEGYAAATIPRIAARADVAPRTVSTWFPAKDDILFVEIDEAVDRATRHLRAGTGDTVDRLQQWLADESSQEHHDPETFRLREAAIAQDPELRARAHRHLEQLQSEVAAAVARDVGGEPDDVGVQAFTGAVTAYLFALRALGLEPRDDDDAQRKAGVSFLRASLAALSAGT
jgi:AcrR family transcriptional regulator